MFDNIRTVRVENNYGEILENLEAVIGKSPNNACGAAVKNCTHKYSDNALFTSYIQTSSSMLKSQRTWLNNKNMITDEIVALLW